jgi:carbamate kinase
MQRIVVVFGGNAFANPGGVMTMESQLKFARSAVTELMPLLSDNTQLLISHGNGPQVGHILTRVEAALGKAYTIPLEVCVAESEGEIGYVLEQSIYNVLAAHRKTRSTVSLLTQVVVDADDRAFQNPTKPVGPFFTEAQALHLRECGLPVVEDAGRGYRRVVSSPRPKEILEIDIIEQLVAMGIIVIAAGGGGIPVIKTKGQLQGVEAVVDKDLTAALLANQLDAHKLIILTCVPCAYEHYRTERQRPIGTVSRNRARALLTDGHFEPGSMQPKIQAAIDFVSRPGRQAIICDPPSLRRALDGSAGTIVRPT